MTVSSTTTQEPSPHEFESGSSGPSTTPVERLRLVAISLAITLGVVLQDSGRLATDTKLDLVVNPSRFLSQALSLWDPLGEGGRIQNQAYGYLFPMGPFYLVGDLLDFPAWATQRLWESAVLVIAFVGAFLLARSLGVRTFAGAAASGLAFALTPRVLSELMFNSAELLPTMIVPWVLLPLVRGSEHGSPRRAALLSGLAFLLAGGTNAGASLAILPIPAIWLMTRERGPRRAALWRWWIVGVVLASVWWVVPLLLLGRYSPPFLEWIEAAENTTVTTSMLAALRGVPHWVSYLGSGYWPAGWDFVSEPPIIAATTLVAAAGLIGLARSSVPHRAFLFGCLACGLVGVTFGHASRVGPPFDGAARDLLDGVLIPFRNVHKFQGLVTIPLAVGLGFALDRIASVTRAAAPESAFRRTSRHGLRLAVAATLGAIAIGPALEGNLVSAARTQAVAPWWTGAARWLASHSDGARALIVPGAPFPTYLWGATIDDAIQPVARSPWVVRSAVPLAQPGLIRLLDDIEQRFAAGAGDENLAELLARSGIRFVVVRNDLDAVASSAAPQSLIRLTLRSSPGFTLAATIGPGIGQNSNRSWLVDSGAGGARPAIEIFEVNGVDGPVTLLDAAGTVRSNGSSDSLGSLVASGLDVHSPTLLGHDGDEVDIGPTAVAATEGIRRQQDAFGGPFRRSTTLTAAEPYSGDRRTFDYLPENPGALSTYSYLGVEHITASSSAADVRAVFNPDAASGPWSAFDDDTGSSWRPASWGGAVGQWIEVRFVAPIDPGTVRIAFDGDLPTPSRIELTTDAGREVVSVAPDDERIDVPMPDGQTGRLRLTIRGVHDGATAGISSVEIPGVDIERTLNVPGVGSPDVIRFDIAPGYRSDCFGLEESVACSAAFGANGEEHDALDRTFTLDNGAAYELTATVGFVPGDSLDERLDAEMPLDANATSTDSADPRHRAAAAVDGDQTTAWVAAPDDDDPRLELDFGEAREIDAMRLVVDARAPLARPTVVWIHTDDTDWIGTVPTDGLIHLPEGATTRRVDITIVEHEIRRSISMFDRFFTTLPPGISEVRFDPAVAWQPSGATIEIGCDEGLAIVVDGASIPLSVRATPGVVAAGTPVPAAPCTDVPVDLAAGNHRVTFASHDLVRPISLQLTGEPLAGRGGTTRTFEIDTWESSHRRIDVGAGDASVLVVHENFNDGWVATIHGQRLEPVRVDGWQQGFIVPSGAAGTIVLSYEPQRILAAGLVGGGVAVLALLALAIWRLPMASAPAAVGERRMRTGVGLVMSVAVAAVLAGPIGAIAVAGTLALVAGTGTLMRRLTPVAGGASVAAAGLIVAASDQAITQADAPAIQTMCVVGVALSFAAPLLRAKTSRSPDG